ncbi:endonuclease/exonuclease/phosphatase family protein [Longispora sp. NPDC051575]|uniref:endonuclease/exonuclease/phosphatase family protein n=1 Tax=Longispora sp. NPDC051575 TaxID=3154943 RepID=UPI0034221C5E
MSGAAADPGRDAAPAAGPGGRLLTGLAVAWLVLVVAHLLLSGRWWPWLAVDLAPPLVFVLVPAVLLAVAGPRRRFRAAVAATAALALGAGLSGLHPSALWTGRPAAPADAVRVLAWNTEAWHLSGDPEGFVRYLAAQDADVYLLQEYQPADQAGTPALTALDAELLGRLLPDHRAVAVGELLTLSRLPVTGVRPLPAAPRPDTPWIEVYRAVKSLRVDVRVGGRTLSVYNAHLPVPLELDRDPATAGFYAAIATRHAARLAQYRALAADVAANPNPVLLAGDLNTTPAMGELRELPDRLTPAVEGPLSASWPVALPLWRLDWAFTDRVRVHAYQLHDPPGMSDHRVQRLVVSLDRSTP